MKIPSLKNTLRPFLEYMTILFLVAFGTCSYAQQSFPVSELRFEKFFAARAGDSATYCLLGNGYFRTISSDEEDSIISDWLRTHPKALAVPVSITGEGSKMPMVYFWAVDGSENLNLYLVTKGAFPGSVMLDAVHFFQLARGSRESADAERGYNYYKKIKPDSQAVKELPPRRLVSDSSYRTFVKKLLKAEDVARNRKVGIWSDRFKDLREEERIGTP